MNHLFKYKWKMSEDYPKEKNGLKVFSCFACGGGSSMGYKLAGYEVLGCNEIDPRMMEVYKLNHKPKYSYLEGIQTFRNREDLPDELYNLDILDGSPPCSSYSVSGNREKDWGKKKKFREGQAEQVLDTLFFDFIDLAKKLQPKVIVAENVKGLLMGNAKKYASAILEETRNSGYFVDYKLLDASKMGVPQKRERVFFYAIRKDLYKGNFVNIAQNKPELDLEFNEKKIVFSEISQKDKEFDNNEWLNLWNKMKEGDSLEKYLGYGFNSIKVFNNKVLPTIVGTQRINSFKSAGLIHPKQCRKLNKIEFCLAGTYPVDYDFTIGNKNSNFTSYLIGMSVPPVMMAQIAKRIYDQWGKYLN